MRRFVFALLTTVAITGFTATSAHAATSTPVPKDQPNKHIVANGESLSIIATDNSLETWRPIWNANADLQNPDQINAGQELIIPKPTDTTTDRPLPEGYGEPTPVAVATAPVQAYSSARVNRSVSTAAPSGDILARIRMRESGGNYATNTGNGYYGAYQYNDGTWGGYGGYIHASDAPASVQDAKAAATYAARGCSPWPNTCY